MKFSLLHPSRSRPQKSHKTVTEWLNTCVTKDVEVIVSIDETDPCKDDYFNIYKVIPKVRLIVRPSTSAVEAINHAAKESSGDVLIVVSDDTDCINQWDVIISKAAEGHSDYVLKVFDGIQKWIVTMPIMDRTYYNRFGYVYHPDFKHMFCDTFLTHQADALKRIIWRNDIRIDHLHYSVKKSVKDQVSVNADNTLLDGENVYRNLIKQNLLIEGDIWNLSEYAATHVQWCKNKRII